MDPDPEKYGLWYAYSGPFKGIFKDTTRFEGFLDPGWQFLLDGKGEVKASLAPFFVIGGVMVTPPSAVINN